MISSTPYGEVLQIQLSRYPSFPSALWVCAYLVDGMLVDTGPAHTASELTGFMKDKVLRIAVNTHSHEDHIAANKPLQEAYNTVVYAHPLAVEKIGKPASLFPYQKEVWGYPVPSRVRPLGDYVETEHYRFDVIPTPGHETGHVCLFEKTQGWLFTGDLYVTAKPDVCRPNDDMWQTLADLKTVAALEPQVMFPAPAHVVEGPMRKLAALISYLQDLGGRIDQLYNTGMDADNIRQEVFGDEGYLSKATQGQFSSLNMVKSFLKKHG